MLTNVLNWILGLFGFNNNPDPELLQILKKRKNKAENKLKEIEDEKSDINDVIDRLND